MKYDFTSILNRDGMDAIAVNPPMNASWISFAPIKEGFDLIPMWVCLLYTSPSPRDRQKSRMPSSA